MIRATTFVVSSPLTVAAYHDTHTHHKVRCVVAVNVAAYRDTRHNVGSVVAINGSDGSCGVRFQWIKQRTAKKHIETGF